MAVTPIVVLRAIVAVCALALAVVTLRARRGALENRLLALFLALEGLSHAVSPVRQLFPESLEREMWAASAFRTLGIARLGALLAILGTLAVPLARPFATRIGLGLALGLTAAILAWGALFPGWLIVHDPASGPLAYAYIPTVAMGISVAAALVAVYVVAVGAQAISRSPPGSLERARAKALLGGLSLIAGPTLLQGATMATLELLDPALHGAYMQGAFFGLYPYLSALLSLGGMLLLVVGMLRVHLYEVDLRVKWTLRRGTVGAVFVAAFLVVAQLVQGFFSTELGWAVGGLMAGLLLFALRPIERFAERFADAAMPRVKDTPEWRHERRIEIYRTAVRLALADAKITREEERELANLATQLGLDPRQALDVRTQVEDDARSLAA